MKIFEGISPDSKTLHYILKTGAKGDMIAMNPKTQKREAIRYASNQLSPFISEQVGTCILPSIVMEEGYLKVSKTDTSLLAFLDISPQNGKVFREVDPERDAEESMRKDEEILGIKAAILEKSKEDHGDIALASLLAMMSNNDYTIAQVDAMGPNQVRQILYTIAKSTPEDFLDEKGKVNCFNSNDFIRQDLVIRSLNEGIIKVSTTGREIYWGNDEELISVPTGKDYKVYLADYFLSNEGEKVMQDLAQKLEKLYKK